MSIIQPISEPDPSLNARQLDRGQRNDVQNQSKKALDVLVSQIDSVEVPQMSSFLREYTFGQNLQNDALALSIMLSMTDVSLGTLSTDILSSLKTIFNLSTSQIDVHLVGMIAKFVHLGEAGQLNDGNLVALKQALGDLQNHSNTTLRNLANRSSRLTSNSSGAPLGGFDGGGVPFSDQPALSDQGGGALSDQGSSALHAELAALQSKSTEPATGQLSPTVSAPVSFSGERQDAFNPASNAMVAQSEDGSVKVDVSRTLAEIAVHTSAGAAAFTSATVDPKGRIHQVGIVELNGIHMVMSPLVAALISNLVSKRIQENRAKVAIVCDSVACLDGMERTDSIYVVDVSKDLSVLTFSNIYQELIDKGYHRIMSLHVSPLLDKTYRLAKEAATDVVDADVKVVNSHANGLGLGILIREIKEAVDHNFSPTEIGALIKRSILRMKHWWVPFAFNYQKSAAWLERTMDTRARMKLKMLRFKPVISLQNDQLRLSDAFFDEETALRHILKSVKDENQKRARKLIHIGVEYRGQIAYRHALALKNKLQVACPRARVTLHTAGSVTVYRLGAELIGVCVI